MVFQHAESVSYSIALLSGTRLLGKDMRVQARNRGGPTHSPPERPPLLTQILYELQQHRACIMEESTNNYTKQSSKGRQTKTADSSGSGYGSHGSHRKAPHKEKRTSHNGASHRHHRGDYQRVDEDFLNSRPKKAKGDCGAPANSVNNDNLIVCQQFKKSQSQYGQFQAADDLGGFRPDFESNDACDGGGHDQYLKMDRSQSFFANHSGGGFGDFKNFRRSNHMEIS